MISGQPLTIGLVGPLPPPSGGMANQTEQLVRLLAESGLCVELVRTNAPCRPAWVERIRGVRALWRLGPYVVTLWRCAGRVDVMHVMANSGWAWHLLAAPAVWIAHLRAKPAIVNYRGGEAERFFARQFRWVVPTLRRARCVIVPSGFLLEVFGRWGIKAEIVPNIVNLERFRPGPRMPGRLHILVARNLEDVYDIPTALRAFSLIRAAHPHARLSIAGSGPRRRDLERLCAELEIGAAVTFTGRLDNERMADLYRDADLLLNPALADNMPISLLEAMASGVPIVSTNVGGTPYLVEHGKTALLVEPRDPAAMVEAALRVVGDPALAARLRISGLEAVRQFAWPNVRTGLLAVYAAAAGQEQIACEVSGSLLGRRENGDAVRASSAAVGRGRSR
jgi:glycosyltransferase involved in cell wall biosynthesis